MFVAGKELPKTITVGNFHVDFEKCKIKEGVKIIFTNSARLVNCAIEKDCTIGSSLHGIHYDSSGKLTIKCDHWTCYDFSFNNIIISSMDIINSKLIIENTGTIDIRGGWSDRVLYLENSKLTIKNEGTLKMRSFSTCLMADYVENIEITNYGDMFIQNTLALSGCKDVNIVCKSILYFNLSNRGILIEGKGSSTFIIGNTNYLILSSTSKKATIDFGEECSRWNNVIIKNKGPFEITNTKVQMFFNEQSDLLIPVELKSGSVMRIVSPHYPTNIEIASEICEILRNLKPRSVIVMEKTK